MNHNANLIKHFSKLSPRKEYIYCWERGQWYEGYDEMSVPTNKYGTMNKRRGECNTA